MNAIKEWLASKKAKAFLAGLLLVVLTTLLEVEEVKAKMLVDFVQNSLFGYLGAQGAVDVAKAIKQ